MNNLPGVILQPYPNWELNPQPLDNKSSTQPVESLAILVGGVRVHNELVIVDLVRHGLFDM